MLKKKAILILGASNDQLSLIKTASSMGLETVVVDANKNAIGLKQATYAKAIDFSDTTLVINYAQTLIEKGVQLSGVITMGSDVPHLVAKIAKHFSWISPGEEVAKFTTNKFLMKQLFESFHIPIPNYALVESAKDIVLHWERWDCSNIIIKPVDSAGSRGVSICNDKNLLEKLFLYAKESSKSGQVLIEEFIEGDQISTETVVYNGLYTHPGFADRVYQDTKNFYPYIMENGGWQPSQIQGSKKKEIYSLIENIAEALKFEQGILKGDIVYSSKYNKAMVIEVASRLSGGDFSASLVPLAHNINYIETAIKIALQEKVDLDTLLYKENYIVANRYFFVPCGTLEAINFLDKVAQNLSVIKLEFNYKIGDKIPNIKSHGDRVGVFIVKGKTYQEVQNIINIVYQTITFTVDGKTYNGHPQFYSHCENNL